VFRKGTVVADGMVELARLNKRKLCLLKLVERRQEPGHHVAVVPFKSYFVNERT